MTTTDLALIESLNGGDLVLMANDLQTVSGFQNMPYLAMFGGNVGFSTTGPKVTEQSFDHWANFLFYPTTQPVWFNSLTEKLLQDVALTPTTRIEIEQTVKKDLEFMTAFASIDVNVYLIGVDRLRIEITAREPNNLQASEFTYIWDATQQELTTVPTSGIALDTSINGYIVTGYIDDYFE